MTPEDRALLRELFSNPGLERPFAVFEKKVNQYGRAAGSIQVRDRAEAMGLGGLLGRHLRIDQRIRLSTIEQHLLEETRFRCTLREAVEAVRGSPLITRPERRDAAVAAWEAAVEDMESLVSRARLPEDARARIDAWLADETVELKRRWSRDGDRLLKQMESALRCLESLPNDGRSRSLAELANHAVGDPHALDRDRSLSGLFDRLLAVTLDVEFSGSRAAARDELLAAAGVVQDRTSAKVDTFGLLGRRPDLAALDQYPLRSFTLRELEAMPPGELTAPGGELFVVENASVFDWLVERLLSTQPESRPALACTNGWLNMADRNLLRALSDRGIRIRYAGDFDDRGLAIARDVLTLCPGAELWRMSGEDYAKAAKPTPDRVDEQLISGLQPTFPELVDAILDDGRVVYQEALQELLLQDLSASPE